MRVSAVPIAAVWALFATSAWAQVDIGQGANGDSGVIGQFVLDRPAAQSRPFMVLMKFALIEFSLPRNEAAGNLDWPELLANLRGYQLRAEPSHAGVIEIWSAAETQDMLDKIRKSGNGRTLSEPTLVTVSGREAALNSGGEVPVTVPQESGAAKVEYRPLGIRITATPFYDNQRFRIQLRVVFNQLVGRTPSDPPAPIIKSSMLDAPIELREGQAVSFVSAHKPTESSPAKLWMVVMTPSVDTAPEPQAPHPIENDGLRDLHDEIKLLRGDVSRLIELLEQRLPKADSANRSTAPAAAAEKE